EIAQSRRLRNRVVEVLTQTSVAVICDVLLDDRLIQPISRRRHPASERRVPLDDLLLTVAVSPRLDLRTPPPRIRCQLLHVVLGERIIDSPVDVTPRDTPPVIAGVLPHAEDEEVRILHSAADEHRRVSRRRTIEREDDLLLAIDDTLLVLALIESAEGEPRARTENRLAKTQLPEHGLTKRLTCRRQPVLRQERLDARHRRISRLPRFHVVCGAPRRR